MKEVTTVAAALFVFGCGGSPSSLEADELDAGASLEASGSVSRNVVLGAGDDRDGVGQLAARGSDAGMGLDASLEEDQVVLEEDAAELPEPNAPACASLECPGFPQNGCALGDPCIQGLSGACPLNCVGGTSAYPWMEDGECTANPDMCVWSCNEDGEVHCPPCQCP